MGKQKNRGTFNEGSRGTRRDRLVQERLHDTYELRQKLPEPTVCPECSLVYQQGKWTWIDGHVFNANKQLCPACSRIHDNYPGGYVSIKGPFFLNHRNEIINLIHNVEQESKQAHPLERIIKIIEEEDGVLVTITDLHLARRIGEAIHNAYQGSLEFDYPDDEKLIRVKWYR